MRHKTEPEHGTRSGYDWHRRDKHETPCEPCSEAERVYWRLQRVIRKETINENSRLRRIKNKHTYISRRNRARRNNVDYGYYTDQDVLDTYGTNCHICNEAIDFEAPRQCGRPGWELGFHVDHVHPISKGGVDTLENVRPAHGKCNIIKWATVAD